MFFLPIFNAGFQFDVMIFEDGPEEGYEHDDMEEDKQSTESNPSESDTYIEENPAAPGTKPEPKPTPNKGEERVVLLGVGSSFDGQAQEDADISLEHMGKDADEGRGSAETQKCHSLPECSTLA